MVLGCGAVDPGAENDNVTFDNVTFTYRIDSAAVAPSKPASEGLYGGAPRPLAALIGPDGTRTEFVENEVIIRPTSPEVLNAFLQRYGGTVISDGTVPVDPDIPHHDLGSSGYYLVRIDPALSNLDDLIGNVEQAGVDGEVVFSSETAARLVSLLARETSVQAAADLLLYPTDDSEEHPFGDNLFETPDAWPWMSENNRLSTGVTRAWDYLRYHGIPPTIPEGGGSAAFTPVVVAVIDRGFALDPVTGLPMGGNSDYFHYWSLGAPWQANVVGLSNRVGGQSDSDVSHGWHGQAAFGICCAAVDNQYGGAGTGGTVVRPLLIRTGETNYSLHQAIWYAAIYDSDVVSMSLAQDCGTVSLCGLLNGLGHTQVIPDANTDGVQSAIYTAISFGATVVAGASNEGEDISDKTIYPCKMDGVICVGAVNYQGQNTQNYGDGVDIWAPEKVYSTVTPWAAEEDDGDFSGSLNYIDSISDEVYVMSGTSAATPFIAGVVALMKAAEPNLLWPQVQSVLQATANSGDTHVARGYVDAYRAVRSVLSNQPPTIQITQPSSGDLIGWKNQPFFRTLYSDPEVDPTDVTAINRFHGEVVVSSSIDGELCRDSSLPYDCFSTKPELTLGQHIITATATDPFEGTATHQITITVVNRPPQPEITKPAGTESLFSHIPVEFVAFVPDPDETITDAQIIWSSNLDGPLGTGGVLLKTLTAGTHTITMTATDGKGMSASDQVVITVTAGAGFPTPLITSPASNTLFGPGQSVTLQGSATDLEDGTLSGASLEWSSNRDGVLGTGNSMTFTPSFDPSQTPGCPGGAQHVITLKATDSDNHVVTVTIIVKVGCII